MRWLFVLAVFLVLLFSSDATADFETGAFLQVENVLVHAHSKSDLNLTCHINGTGLLASDVSWMFKGRWLVNRTLRPDSRTIQLVLRNVSSQDIGVYKCSILDPSKHNIPNQNVTVVIGDLPLRVEKDDIRCIMAGPENTKVKWSSPLTSNGQESSISFDLLYCKPSRMTRYCFHPPLNYTVQCTGLQANTEEPLQCNTNSIVKQEFPDVFNRSFGQVSDKSPNLCFSVRTRSAFGEQYSDHRSCKVPLSWCGQPREVRLSATKSSINIIWNAPMSPTGLPSSFMWYNVSFAAEGDNVNRSQDRMERKGPYNISETISSLQADTSFVVYLSCAIDKESLASPNSVVGPFYIKTLEAAPSSSPSVTKFDVNSQNATNRNVSIFWENPSNRTWNGEIQKFIVFLWKSSENGSFSVVVVWNNVSSNSSPLTVGKLYNLGRFVDYSVKVAMCTSAGCSEMGPEFTIPSDIDRQYDRKVGSSDHHWLVIGISVSGVALLITVAMVVIVVCRTRNKALSQRRGRLSDIANPMPYDYQPAVDVVEAEDADIYDVPDVAEAPESPVGELSTDPLIKNRNENRASNMLEMSTEL